MQHLNTVSLIEHLVTHEELRLHWCVQVAHSCILGVESAAAALKHWDCVRSLKHIIFILAGGFQTVRLMDSVSHTSSSSRRREVWGCGGV